jgi:fluoride exporter
MQPPPGMEQTSNTRNSPRETGWFTSLLARLIGNKMLLIMLGGAVGSYLRYWIGRWAGNQTWGQGFPVGTFLINVTGSFILGFAAAIILERLPPEHEHWYLLIGTGFCGGFTTFSSFEWETYKLARDGSWIIAFANVAGSVLAGFLAVILAVGLAGLLFPRR